MTGHALINFFNRAFNSVLASSDDAVVGVDVVDADVDVDVDLACVLTRETSSGTFGPSNEATTFLFYIINMNVACMRMNVVYVCVR